LAETIKNLTFKEALAAADAPHPDLQMVEADREGAVADERLADSRQDISVNAEGALKYGKATADHGDWSPDNTLALTARKNLYDSGRTSSAAEAAKFEVQAADANVLDARQRRRIDIMSRYFDVLLADLQFTTLNEFMAVTYVNFDHSRDRLKAGQISQVDVAGLESGYYQLLVKRNAAQNRQRITRALLAIAMDRPGVLAENLEDPKLQGNNRVLPDYESLIPVMLQNNTRLKGLEEKLAASQMRLEAIRADRKPTLDAEVQAANYSRNALTRNNLSAGVVLNWPLYQGDRVDARIGKEQAQFHKMQAVVAKLKMDLTQSLLESWMEVDQLQKNGRAAAQKEVDYRDWNLERARGQYEMELKTDLGDSMAQTMEARWHQRQNEYQLALAFARLEALVGKPLDEMPGSEKK
jgi:outer membrane protein TolC